MPCHTLSLQLFVLLGIPDGIVPTVWLADLLPLGLHTLCVYDDYFWSGAETLHQVIGVMECGQMPRLRRLSVVMCTDALMEELFVRLERACGEAGVKLEMNRNAQSVVEVERDAEWYGWSG